MCVVVLALCDSAVETQDPLHARTLPTKPYPTLAKPGFSFSFLACYLYLVNFSILPLVYIGAVVFTGFYLVLWKGTLQILVMAIHSHCLIADT